MAYDPATGEWKPEDTSVEKRLTGLLGKDSLLMQQASTQGKQAANRRGLLNSTMGIQAVETSRINAALPIAQQESSQAHQTNLTGREHQNQNVMQQRDLTHQTGMQTRDIESRERMQGRDIDAQTGMQQRDIAATRERLQMELGSREQMQLADQAAQKERLGMQLSAQESLALQELRAAETRLGMTIAADERMQQRDAEWRERVAGLDREAQERIANLNVAASERNAASGLAAQFELAYAQQIAGIMNNPDIPQSARQQALNHAAAVRDQNLRLVEQLYGIDLDWGAGDGQPNPPGAPTGMPAPPNDYMGGWTPR